jgi:hypothetical protein
MKEVMDTKNLDVIDRFMKKQRKLIDKIDAEKERLKKTITTYDLSDFVSEEDLRSQLKEQIGNTYTINNIFVSTELYQFPNGIKKVRKIKLCKLSTFSSNLKDSFLAFNEVFKSADSIYTETIKKDSLCRGILKSIIVVENETLRMDYERQIMAAYLQSKKITIRVPVDYSEDAAIKIRNETCLIIFAVDCANFFREIKNVFIPETI